MYFEQFKTIFSSLQPLPTLPYAAPLEVVKPYEIVVIYRGKDTAYLEALINQELQAPQGYIEIISKDFQPLGNLLRIGIHLKCPTSQRREIGRLVSRLGLEAWIRSVWWQSEPTQLHTFLSVRILNSISINSTSITNLFKSSLKDKRNLC